MEIQVVAFTEGGWSLAHSVFDAWEGDTIIYRDKQKDGNLALWVEKGFRKKTAIIFIGAMGIAVRSIAPFLENKLADSPVVVLDEFGCHVIPILSGHVGGANQLARRIASICGGEPVITTATDLNGCFAVDVFAVKNKLNILKKDGIAKVSGKILSGKRASIYIEGYSHKDGWIIDADGERQRLPEELVWLELEDGLHKQKRLCLPEELELQQLPEGLCCDIVVSEQEKYLQKALLPLQPKVYALGIGCKKRKLYKEIIKRIEELNIKLKEVCYISSIDIKLNEIGIVELSNRNRIEYLTFSAETLKKVEGEFVKSEFVEKQVGVDNVCERAALAAAGEGGELVMRKQAANGITLALAKRKWRVKFDEA